MRRHVGTNPYCELCSTKVETEAHVFFGCEFFSSIWTDEPFAIRDLGSVSNFVAGLELLKKKLDEAQFGLACVVLWNCWNLRNDLLHNEARGDRDSLVRRSRDFLDSFKSAKFVFPIDSAPGLLDVWKPPDRPFIKINFDAAIYTNGEYRIAAVARDGAGDCVRWKVQKLRGSPAPVVAETCAARLACLLAQQMGWAHVQLEGDSMQVISALNHRDGDNLTPFSAVISACISLISSFSTFTASFIRRKGNLLAPNLAHITPLNVDVLDEVILPAELAH